MPEVAAWINDDGQRVHCQHFPTHIYLSGFNAGPGWYHSNWGYPGDWVVREFGQFRIVSAEHFAEAYEGDGYPVSVSPTSPEFLQGIQSTVRDAVLRYTSINPGHGA